MKPASFCIGWAFVPQNTLLVSQNVSHFMGDENLSVEPQNLCDLYISWLHFHMMMYILNSWCSTGTTLCVVQNLKRMLGKVLALSYAFCVYDVCLVANNDVLSSVQKHWENKTVEGLKETFKTSRRHELFGQGKWMQRMEQEVMRN